MAPPRALTPEQLASALGRLGESKRWRDELRKANRPVARRAAADVRSEMRSSGDRQLAAAARAVRPRVDPTSAAVAVTANATVPFALAATWGRKGRRTGWNAWVYDGRGNPVRVRRVRAASGLRQHPPWVGNTWTVATRGEGPRGVNDALADHIDDYRDEHAQAALSVIVRALPPGF